MDTVSTPHGGLATSFKYNERTFTIKKVSTPHGGLATHSRTGMGETEEVFQLHTVD